MSLKKKKKKINHYLKKYLDKERSNYESSQPKPGEIREWFGQETPWREINL